LLRQTELGLNRVTQGDGQGIRGIEGPGYFLQAQKSGNHELNLFLRSLAAADHRFLDFGWGVMGNGQTRFPQGEKQHASRLSELGSRVGILAEERAFYRRLVGRMLIYDPAQTIVDENQTILESLAVLRADTAAPYIAALAPLVFEQPVARACTAWVNTENDQNREERSREMLSERL